MNRFALALILLVPSTLPAQEKAPIAATNQSETARVAQPDTSQGSENGSLAESTADSNPVSNLDANAAQQPNAKPTQSTAPSEPAPKIPGSMVGYIDNPIVQSLIRIRFDDAFEDQFPDRSEFFLRQVRLLSRAAEFNPAGLRSECSRTGPRRTEGRQLPAALHEC